MIIKLPIKALSINKAFQGRRFKTRECKEYDRTLQLLLLPYRKEAAELLKLKGDTKPRYYVSYIFYLKNAGRTDLDNEIKILQDNLVWAGIIPDDRMIWSMHVFKVKAKNDSINISIGRFDT